MHQIIASLAIENDSLRFGRLSEKLNSQIEQLELWIEEKELTCAEAVATDFSTDSDASKELNKEKPKRLKFPEHLAREDVILNPEATCPECGGTNWRKIADDVNTGLKLIQIFYIRRLKIDTAL